MTASNRTDMNLSTFSSSFIDQCTLRYPSLDLHDTEFVTTATQRDFSSWLEETTVRLNEEAFMSSLCEARQIVWAKLAYLEINDLLPIEQGVNQLSYFAKACIEHVANYCFALLSRRFGVPCQKSSKGDSDLPLLWGVLCMGKLGGDELNFSSDIDIILCYDDLGEVLPQRYLIEGELGSRLSEQEFYQRFAKLFIKLINQPSEINSVFRVDMRLRPFGQSGALVCSYSFLQNYLQNHARDWERLAYAKASVLSHSAPIGQKFSQLIEPFVYRQYTDYGVLQSIRQMRDLISDTLHNTQYELDIKRGFGGIRFLEFSLQSIQLTLYTKYPLLKVRGAFRFLHALESLQLMRGQTEKFRECLIFLRRLEHRLQIWQDQQTHHLPQQDDSEQWQWLADTMRFTHITQLQAQITQVRQRVQDIFAQVLPDVPMKDYVLFQNNKSYNEETLYGWLETIVSMPESVGQLGDFIVGIKQILNSRAWQESSEQARERFSQILPSLVSMIEARCNQSNKIIYWSELFQLLSAILQRSAYLSLLYEYPNVLSRLLDWCQKSPWLIKQVIDYPILLESIINPKYWYQEVHRHALQKQCQAMLENKQLNFERQVNQLREIKRSSLFKIAGLNQAEQISTYQVSDYLTNLAREIVKAALCIAQKELRPQWEERIHLDWNNLPILFIGYGKLGSFELGYASDLDMVILYDDTLHKDNRHYVPFLLRLSRKTMDVLSLHTVAGKCYEVDCRLRPDGDKGSLVAGISQYKEYLLCRAWIWEKQALVKARSIAGNRYLSKQFLQIRQTVLTQGEEDHTLKSEIMAMRDKMRGSLDKSGKHQFDIKQGRGGMIDIEFLSQYWVMRLAHSHPNLLQSRSVSALLNRLSEYQDCGLDTENLITIYLHYRAYTHQLALDNASSSIVNKDMFVKERQKVIAEWEKTFVLSAPQ